VFVINPNDLSSKRFGMVIITAAVICVALITDLFIATAVVTDAVLMQLLSSLMPSRLLQFIDEAVITNIMKTDKQIPRGGATRHHPIR
jgi:hypothetical protein